LETEHFHVALLDVRLDESDEDNQEGLDLMREIKKRDPATAVIILTGYATVRMVQDALQPSGNGVAQAFAFLEKDREMNRVGEYVKRAFIEELKLNFDLEITDQSKILPHLSKQLRFTDTKPSHLQIRDETEEILRRLFFDCVKIDLVPITQGFSGVAVIQIIPWYSNLERAEAVIIKIGECGLVEKECHNYREWVQRRVGGHRLPQVLSLVKARLLAGVVYTFLGSSEDFAAFYQRSDLADVLAVIQNLYEKTCFPWRSVTLHYQEDLGNVYGALLHLTTEKITKGLRDVQNSHHPFRRDDQGNLWLANDIQLVDPVEFALSANLQADCLMSIIHGDIQGHNVLVDRGETWLIDFAKTTQGPIFQDYISLETFIKLFFVPGKDWRIYYEWEKDLVNCEDLSNAILRIALEQHSGIAKAHQAIMRIRQLALANATPDMIKAYLVGLFFNAIKYLTLTGLLPVERDHALISAAVIAERLNRLQ
jgi:CheY-like chemotaxis protein